MKTPSLLVLYQVLAPTILSLSRFGGVLFGFFRKETLNFVELSPGSRFNKFTKSVTYCLPFFILAPHFINRKTTWHFHPLLQLVISRQNLFLILKLNCIMSKTQIPISTYYFLISDCFQMLVKIFQYLVCLSYSRRLHFFFEKLVKSLHPLPQLALVSLVV